MPKKANIFESFSHSAIQQFKEAFGIMDTDKDGLLSASDLVAAFGAHGKSIGSGDAQVGDQCHGGGGLGGGMLKCSLGATMSVPVSPVCQGAQWECVARHRESRATWPQAGGGHRDISLAATQIPFLYSRPAVSLSLSLFLRLYSLFSMWCDSPPTILLINQTCNRCLTKLDVRYTGLSLYLKNL